MPNEADFLMLIDDIKKQMPADKKVFEEKWVDYKEYGKLVKEATDASQLLSIIQEKLAQGLPPNTVVLNIITDKLGKFGAFESARHLFNLAQDLNLVNDITYSNFIHMASENGHFNLAEAAFKTAVNSEIAEANVYNNFLRACDRYDKGGLAHRVFEHAKAKEKTDDITHHIMVEALARHGQMDVAKGLYENSPMYHKIKAMPSNDFKLNTHFFVPATLHFAIQQFLQERLDPSKPKVSIEVVIGRGVHSTSGTVGNHSLRIAMEDFIKNNLKQTYRDYDIQIMDRKGNFILTFMPKAKAQAEPLSSTHSNLSSSAKPTSAQGTQPKQQMTRSEPNLSHRKAANSTHSTRADTDINWRKRGKPR